MVSQCDLVAAVSDGGIIYPTSTHFCTQGAGVSLVSYVKYDCLYISWDHNVLDIEGVAKCGNWTEVCVTTVHVRDCFNSKGIG